jgi:hypothetical protein
LRFPFQDNGSVELVSWLKLSGFRIEFQPPKFRDKGVLSKAFSCTHLAVRAAFSDGWAG